jgi:dUTP pyrophosphatase
MSSSQKLRFVNLTKYAQIPSRKSPRAAGLDLYSARDATVPAIGKALIFKYLQIQLPNDCYGRIAPRSGLALTHHIDIGGGVIDQDYRSNVGVIIITQIPRSLFLAGTHCSAHLRKNYYPEVEKV